MKKKRPNLNQLLSLCLLGLFLVACDDGNQESMENTDCRSSILSCSLDFECRRNSVGEFECLPIEIPLGQPNSQNPGAMMGGQPTGMMGGQSTGGMMGGQPTGGMMGGQPTGGMMGGQPTGGMMGGQLMGGRVGGDVGGNLLPEPICGDGQVNQESEECDDGGESPFCNLDCTLSECGDGVINPRAGEECDDQGESETCNENCTLSQCGDNIINTSAGEECEVFQNSCSSETCLPVLPDECRGSALEAGASCIDSPVCCAPGYGCVETAENERTCEPLCILNEPPPLACPPRELCISLNLEGEGVENLGRCLSGDECSPTNIASCGQGEYSCVRIQNLSFCIGELSAFRQQAPLQVAGLDQACDPFNQEQPVYCGGGLVCEFGVCRAVCDGDEQCAVGEECLDYTNALGGVPYKFCMDVCNPFESECSVDESCVVLNGFGGEVVGECRPGTNGVGQEGDVCTVVPNQYWGTCSSDHVCVTENEEVTEGVCQSFCSERNLDQCQVDYSGCSELNVPGLGLCRVECDPLTGAGCNEDTEMCTVFTFILSSDDERGSITGECLPKGDEVAEPLIDECELLEDPNRPEQPSPYYSTCGTGYYCNITTNDAGETNSRCIQICQDIDRIGLFEVIDTDNSLFISRQEWEIGFTTLDVNQTGDLSIAEWINPRRTEVDLNEDRLISIDEWMAGFDLLTQQQEITYLEYDRARCAVGTCTDIFTQETFWGLCL